MSPSKMRKTQAYQEGRYCAYGASITPRAYTGDHLKAYELGYHEANLEMQAAKEKAHKVEEHPLTPVLGSVQVLDSDIMTALETLREAVESIAEYLIERDQS